MQASQAVEEDDDGEYGGFSTPLVVVGKSTCDLGGFHRKSNHILRIRGVLASR